ncbi:hypothetical protein NIB75_18180 [Bacteroides uniformis]|nr:hypothetical protein [Bacteroides uniformis]
MVQRREAGHGSEYRQGKRNGKEQRFDPKSGKQIYEANYTDDRKEGKQWKISEDTTERWVSKTVSHYKNGELDGPYEYTAHLHGKLYAYKSGSYKNGYKHGSWKEIDRDDIAVQGEYTEGRETGHWIRYDIISGEILERVGPVKFKKHGNIYSKTQNQTFSCGKKRERICRSDFR